MNPDRIIIHSFRLYVFSIIGGTACFFISMLFPFYDTDVHKLSAEDVQIASIILICGFLFGIPSMLVHMGINAIFRSHVAGVANRWIFETMSALVLAYIPLLILSPNDSGWQIDEMLLPYYYGSAIMILWISVRFYQQKLSPSQIKHVTDAD